MGDRRKVFLSRNSKTNSHSLFEVVPSGESGVIHGVILGMQEAMARVPRNKGGYAERVDRECFAAYRFIPPFLSRLS